MSFVVDFLARAVFTLLVMSSTSSSARVLQSQLSKSFLKSIVAFGDSYSDAGAPWGRWTETGGRAPLVTFYPSNGVSTRIVSYVKAQCMIDHDQPRSMHDDDHHERGVLDYCLVHLSV